MNKPRREALQKIIDGIQQLSDELESLRDEEEEYRDNIPENMQGSERYEKADETVGLMTDAVDSLASTIDSIESALEQSRQLPGKLAINDESHHVIINDPLVSLGGMHKAQTGDPVNLSWQATGEIEDGGYSRVGKNVWMRTGGIAQMSGYIVSGLAAVKGRDVAA